MRGNWIFASGVAALIVACAPQPASDVEATGGTAMDTEMEAPAQPAAMGSPTAMAELRCEPSARMPVEDRTSPYDSTAIPLGDTQVLICYGRPSLRGRTMIGGQNVPYGRLWRTGANEPTILHTPVPLEIAGIMVEPGSYSLYTIPGEDEWTLIVNRSTSQWGVEGQVHGRDSRAGGSPRPSTDRADRRAGRDVHHPRGSRGRGGIRGATRVAKHAGADSGRAGIALSAVPRRRGTIYRAPTRWIRHRLVGGVR